MRWLGLLMLVGCVGEAPPDQPPPPNPAPPAGDRGSADEEESGSQTQVTATEYLIGIAKIHCQQAFNCRATYPNDAATFDARYTMTLEGCVENLTTGWGVDTIETEIAKGRIEYDGSAAVDCLAGVAFGSCDEHWVEGIQWAESCYSVMVGNVPTGGSCESLYACQSYSCDPVERRCL